MKNISYKKIIKEVSELIKSINYGIDKKVKKYIRDAYRIEKNPLSKKYLETILENIKISEKEKIPLCQDTGFPVVFVEMGCDVYIEKGPFSSLTEIINYGIEKGSKEGYLRNSVVDPVERKYLRYNSPSVIHFFEGEKGKLKITVMSKGFGAENTGKMKMLKVSEGKKGIEKFVIETVKESGASPCPPVFIGVGIGGTFEMAPLLSKIALLKIGEKSPYRIWEKKLKEKINKLNIGPGGFGGKTTVLDIRIETHPTHIAGLPIAVNISCWAHRTGSVEL